jgi:hypothetical protein
MNDQDFDFQVSQDPKDPRSQVSPILLAALGVTLVLAGGYYFWSSPDSTAAPTIEASAPNPVEAPATATVPKVANADTALATPAEASSAPSVAPTPISAASATPVASRSGALIPSSNTQFLTNQAIKGAGREDPFKSAAAPIPAPPILPKLLLPPSLLPPENKTAAISPETPPSPVAVTVPLKGIFQVQQDAYVVIGHEGGDEILRAGDYLDSPDQVQVVLVSPSARTVTFREKGKDIVRNVEANP